MSAEDGELVYVTKGDNSDVDPFKVKASAVTGLVVKNLGPIGHPVLLLSNSKIMVYLGLPIVVFVGVVVASLKFSSGNTVSQRPATGRVPRESSSEYFALETERLATAIVEFGAHLETHTAIVKVVSSASERLEESVHVKKVTNADLNDAVLKQNQILTGLLVAVENLNEQKSIDAGLSAHDSSIKPTPKETSKVA
ncbi:MAG: hypothetical protein IIB17_03590 [Chloroflexi bacterium]|nr:hypothetical protein [Chloroflexota bacterium]